ncbi:MAG: toprim domain-containing protein [Bacteroidales bacterium]|nr:toprim domain-containing protein [Bacteroidales bacterium]
MSFYELKEIPITDLLTHLGYRPVSMSKGGRQWLYHSPLRDDRNASFCVSSDKNIWYDFGTAKGGNVIDLARALNGDCSFRYAASWLEAQSREFTQGPPLASLLTKGTSPHGSGAEMRDVKVGPLTHSALFSYLWSRGIPAEIGRRYCQEVHYAIGDRKYFALCFMNILGGMEIRNPFFKGGYGVKAPTVVTLSKTERTPACCVFEGFMDFLSYQTLLAKYDDPAINAVPRDCIILNSTSMVQKAIPFIQVYDVALTYLDNDSAGRQAVDVIEAAMVDRTIRMSDRFYGFNDLNDYLINEIGRDL